MDIYQILLVAALGDDLAEIRRIIQAAVLPEPLTCLIQTELPDIHALTPDLILVKYSVLESCCEGLLSRFEAQLPDVPVILLVSTEERSEAEPLAEAHYALLFDYAQGEPSMLRQLVRFAAKQRNTQRRLQWRLQAFSDGSRLLHNLIEHNADGILVVDQEGLIRFANPMAAALFGRSAETLVGMSFGFPVVLEQAVELDLRRADGRECIAEMRLVMIEWEGQAAYLATLRDVTERSLEKRYLQHRLALESMLAALSAQFVSLPIAEVDARITEALSQLGQFIGAEYAVLAGSSERASLAITHLWEASHLVGQCRQIEPELAHHLYTETFEQGDFLVIPDTEQLPADHPAQDFVRVCGARALMALAMRDGGRLSGCLVFAAISQARPWQYEDAALFSIAADVFASTLRRAKINRKLRESEARLRFVITSAPLILFTFDADGVINFLEGALLDKYFPELRHWVGHSALDDPYIGAHLMKVLRGQACRLTFELPDKAALEVYLTPVLDESNLVVVGGIGVGVDVTERQRAQEAERRQAGLLRTLAEASIALTSSLEVQCVLETILEYAERLVPCDGSSVVLFEAGQGRVSAARGRSSHLTQARWDTLLANTNVLVRIDGLRRTGTVGLIPDTAADPDWLPIEGTEWIRSYLGVPIELEGRTIGIIQFDSATPNYFTQEHTEYLRTLAGYAAIALQNADLYQTIQRNAKDLERHVRLRTNELEVERSRLRAILDAIEEAVIFFELQDAWRITYTNPAFYHLFGYREEELIGQSLAEITQKFASPLPMPDLEHVGRVIEREGHWHSPLRFQRKDGSSFDSYTAASKVTDLRGRSTGVVVLVRDISKEKALQAQKDRFIANAAHELRTPLTNLKMRLYLLRRQPEAAQAHLSVIERVVNRIQALVEDLLDMTRFERGMITLNRAPVYLTQLLEDVIQVQRPHFEHKYLQLTSDLPAEDVPILADAERLTQVFTNLLVNALNYTQEGGWVHLSLTYDASNAIVEVQDGGVGIAPDALEHVFEPFFRAQHGSQRGTGLGLTIAHEIVRAHNGSIEARSQLGAGTTMIVRLPLAQ
ncbi:MAG: PAS domain S-box protein [Aggregatilineales bacterium]